MNHEVKLLIMRYCALLHTEGVESQVVRVQKRAKTGPPENDLRFCVQKQAKSGLGTLIECTA